MPSTVEILFPPVPLATRNTLQTVAELRAEDSTLIDQFTEVLVVGIGFYNYSPSSLAVDNGTSVLKPDDLTSLQAGRWLLVNILNTSNINFTADDALAEMRTLQSKLGDWVNVLDFHDSADGDNLTTAMQNAIYFAFLGDARLQLQLPPGVWKCDAQFLVPRQVWIRGAGLNVTILNFEDASSVNATMKGAFSFGTNATLTAYDPAYGTKVQGPSSFGSSGGSDFSEISDMTIYLDGSVLQYGLWTAGRLFAANIFCIAGGFKTTAGTLIEGVGTVTGNANGSTYYNCQAILPVEHGYFFDGTDANACTITAPDVFGPANTAYFDASFLGNTYDSPRCDPAGTGLVGYHTEGAANRTVFHGPYCENGFATANWDVALPSLIIAPKGQMPAAVSGKNCVLTASDSAGLVTGGQFNFVADLNGSAFGSSSIPATRAFPFGVYIRGQGGNGDIYQLVSQGGQVGPDPSYGAGVSLIKRGGVSGTNYQLMYLGDAANMPSFPVDFMLPNQRTPASASAAGTKGEVCADASFIYVCTATNTWKRVAIATW